MSEAVRETVVFSHLKRAVSDETRYAVSETVRETVVFSHLKRAVSDETRKEHEESEFNFQSWPRATQSNCASHGLCVVPRL